MNLTELRGDFTCASVRVALTVNTEERMPAFVSQHIPGCSSCTQHLSTRSELGQAFDVLRSEVSEAPPGLVSSVVDSLGVRLPGDRGRYEGPRFGTLVRKQRVAAISTAVVAAAATGLVVTHRKRAEMAH